MNTFILIAKIRNEVCLPKTFKLTVLSKCPESGKDPEVTLQV